MALRQAVNALALRYPVHQLGRFLQGHDLPDSRPGFGKFLKVMVPAAATTSLINLFREGDIIIASSIRPAGTAETQLTSGSTRFQSALSQLNVPKYNNFRKEITFSAIADARNLMTDVLANGIDIVGYNQEPGTTPTAELGSTATYTDEADSAVRFAEVVQGAGLIPAYGPTRVIFDGLEATGTVPWIAGHMRQIGYQGQNVLSTMEANTFLTTIIGKIGTVRNAIANCEFQLQLTGPQQTPAQMISIFNRFGRNLDCAVINISTASDVFTVMEAVR